ncbi:D-amino-acid N-acetyltransferase [Burkholderiales bacterium]|nr:D-amino-acid N-acetyltransferase [Burkholderiales bacterium]
MGEHSVRVRPIRASDERAWRELWRGYCEFYEVALAEDVTRHTFARIADPGSPVSGIVAESVRGDVVGIANYLLHENTWTTTPVCYLEDLFVAPAARGNGAGRALLDWLVSAARENGWSRLYWMTRHDNVTARRLYDHYAKADGFVRYVVVPPRSETDAEPAPSGS